MMKLHKIVFAIGAAGILSACDQIPSNSQNEATAETPATAAEETALDTSKVLASVNGQPITENLVALYSQQRKTRRPNEQADSAAILDEVISLELARQDGEKQGVDKDIAIALQIDQQQRAVIATAAIQHYLQQNPVTDDDLKKLYAEKMTGGKEFKARHILVETREEATGLIGELNEGADFSELAKEHSTGPSGKNGGDLGWFAATQMVAPFSEAASKLEKGSYTSEPVETQFGWHIIILDDMRDSTPPPFEQVRSQLQTVVQSQAVQAYVQQLRDDADIEIVAEATAEDDTSGEVADTAAHPED
jgi:peptidyl-prolyl cis-trans isomerase C